MNLLIRAFQVILGITALNQVFGLTLLFTVNPVYGTGMSNLLDVVGSVISVLVYFIIIFFLQSYYEKRNGQKSNVQRFTTISLILLGIVIFLAVAIIVLLVFRAFISIR